MADAIIYVVSVTRIPNVNLLSDQEAAAAVQPRRNVTPGTEVGTPNAWLFQSNPVLYDLMGALRSLQEQVWSVSRYAREIRAGDRIYLWEAGKKGGIAGLAEIIEPPQVQPEPPEQLPFARDAMTFAGDRVRARLRILRVIEPVIARKAVIACPPLGALGVVRCSRGTNFRLSLEEWKALDGLILGTASHGGDRHRCSVGFPR